MGASLIVPELRRQPVPLVETREARLIVLVRVSLPAELVDQFLHRLFLEIRYRIERLDHANPLDEPVVDLELEDRRQGKGFQGHSSKLTVNVPDLSQVRRMVVPLQRLTHALRGVVGSREDVLYLVFGSKVV